MMLRHRGVRLYGPEIEQVFGPVSDEVFENSIYQDIRTAQEDILKAPVYVILNLCRAVAYIEEGLLLSKREGVEWALNDWQLAPYQGMIRAALKAYQEGESMPLDHEAAQNFARIMLSRFTTRPFSPFEKQWMALFAADIPISNCTAFRLAKSIQSKRKDKDSCPSDLWGQESGAITR